MREDRFILHEWQKEKFDKLIAENMKEDAIKEGLEQGIEQGIEKGIEQGKEEKVIEMIKSMLENNANYEFISKVSNKTIEEIKEIEKTMN